MKTINSMCVDGYAKISVCMINKVDAKEMLLHNSKNRKISKDNVVRLRKSMNDGRWLFNGDTIVFDADGYLKSGQHRISAFVESDLEDIVMIVVNLFNEQDVLTTLNRGKSMTNAQYFSINGIKDASKVCSVAKGVLKIVNGGSYGDTGNEITDYEIEAYYKEHRDLIDEFVSFCRHDGMGICNTLCSAMVFTCLNRPDKKDRLVQICTSIVECVSAPNSIENSLIRLNRTYRGKLGHEAVGLAFRKFISVIGEYIVSGRVKEKVYGISESEFVKLVTKNKENN